MRNRPGRRRSFRQIVNCDLELRPLMNVFIVLIPMLLMSAVFMEIRVIEMTLPRVADASEPKPPEPSFDLSIRIRANSYIVEGNGVTLLILPREVLPDRAAALGDSTSARLSRALGVLVAAHPANREVRIVAEARTRYREIVDVMDAARLAGLPQVGLEGSGIEGS